jgi:hypothetical protein
MCELKASTSPFTILPSFHPVTFVQDNMCLRPKRPTSYLLEVVTSELLVVDEKHLRIPGNRPVKSANPRHSREAALRLDFPRLKGRQRGHNQESLNIPTQSFDLIERVRDCCLPGSRNREVGTVREPEEFCEVTKLKVMQPSDEPAVPGTQ